MEHQVLQVILFGWLASKAITCNIINQGTKTRDRMNKVKNKHREARIANQRVVVSEAAD
jgi:hypothetical protein